MTLFVPLDKIFPISNAPHHCLHFTIMNLFISATESTSKSSTQGIWFSTVKFTTPRRLDLWYVPSLMGAAPHGTATQWSTYSLESPRWIHSLRTWHRAREVKSCGRDFELVRCRSGAKSSGLFHSAWSSVSSEQSGWQRTRHQHCYYKGLKADRAPEAPASLRPWILHNKVHNTQYPHLSCPLFIIPLRGPDGFKGI